MNPKISIIIPAYNREKVILKTLEAILSQSFVDWECLVVDDHSKDATRDSIMQFVAKDSRFVFLENERAKGACGARNTGLQHAKGDFVLFFDSDDRMHKELLASLYERFTNDVDVVTCWTNVVDVTTEEVISTFCHISEGNIHDQLLDGKTYVDTNCALIRREICLRVKGWSEDCPSYQEWDFHLRVSKIARYTTIQTFLIDYFVGGSDTISKSNYRIAAGEIYILQKFEKEFLWKHPVSYLRNVYQAYWSMKNIEANKKQKQEDLISLYNKEISPMFRFLAKSIFAFRALKKRFSHF